MGWNNLSVNLAPQQNQLLNLSHSAQNSWEPRSALDSEGLRKDVQAFKDSANDIMKPMIDREIGNEYLQKKEEVKQSKLAELSRGNENIYNQLKEKQALKDFITAEADEAAQMTFGTNLKNASNTLDAYAKNNGYLDMTTMLAAAQSGDQQANRKLMNSGIGDIAQQVKTLNTQYDRIMTQPLDYKDHMQLGEAMFRKGLVNSIQEGFEKSVWSKEGNGMLQLQEQGLKSMNDAIAQNKWVNQHYSQDQLKPNERPQVVSNQTPQIHSQYNSQTLANRSQKSTLNDFKFELENTEQTQQDTTLPTDTKPKYRIENSNGIFDSNDEESLSQVNNLKEKQLKNQNLTLDDFANNEKALAFIGLTDEQKTNIQKDIKQYKFLSEKLKKNEQVNSFLQKNNLTISQLSLLKPNTSEYNEWENIRNNLSPELIGSIRSLTNLNERFQNSELVPRLNKTNIMTQNIPKTSGNTSIDINKTFQDSLGLLQKGTKEELSTEETTQLAKNYEELALKLSSSDLKYFLKYKDNPSLSQEEKIQIDNIIKGINEATNNLIGFVNVPAYGKGDNESPEWVKKAKEKNSFDSDNENFVNMGIYSVEQVDKLLGGTFDKDRPQDKIEAVNALTDNQFNIKNYNEFNNYVKNKKIKSIDDLEKLFNDTEFLNKVNNALESGIFKPNKIINSSWTDRTIVNSKNQTIGRNETDATYKVFYLMQRLIASNSLPKTKETGYAIKQFLTKWTNDAIQFQNTNTPNINSRLTQQGNK